MHSCARNDPLIKGLESQGLFQAIVDLIPTIKDETVLLTYLETMKNVSLMGISINLEALAPVLQEHLTPRLKAQAGELILNSLKIAATDPKIAQTLTSMNGFEKVRI